ncbi:MAG: glycosyltransferase family 87 protein [Candidatus Obscuribacterales bacterium]
MLKRLLRTGAIIWFAVVVLMLTASALIEPAMRVSSDFHMNFYGAAYLVLHGQAQMLYPAAEAATFKGSQFDVFMHQHFPTLDVEKVGTYPYSPLVAVLFLPFALIPAHYSLLLWEGLNIVGLWLYARLARTYDGISALDFFLSAFCFLPIVATLWIGQCSIAIGLLPLAAGYLLLRSKKDFAAGVLWSLLLLKPQYYPVVLITALCSKRPRLAGGLVAGTIVISVATVTCLSPGLFTLWIQSGIRLAETLFSGAVIVPPNLVACVPGDIIIGLPPEQRMSCKWLIYGASGLIVLAGLGATIRHCLANVKDDDQYMDVLLVLNLIALPMYSRLLVYDLSLYVLIGHLIFGRGIGARGGVVDQRFRKLGLALLITLNLQVVLATFLKVKLSFLIAAILTICIAASWWIALQIKSEDL